VLYLQKTVGDRVEMTGTALHSGAEATVTFLPAPTNTGIVFRVGTPQGQLEIPALIENVPAEHSGMRNTKLAADGAEVQTVEHVLSALAGLGVTNCYVDLDGPEPPEPKSGSTVAYVELLESVGVVSQGLPSNYLQIDMPISWSDGEVSLQVVPCDTYRITCQIEYDDPLIGIQEFSCEITPDVYKREIAPCRTFAMRTDVEKLKSMGLGQGGTLENALIVENGGLVNDLPLRFPDEFVRHKILDLIGDLALVGVPIQGHVIARRSGHDGNLAFARLLARKERKATRIYPQRQPKYWDIASIMKVMPHRYPFLLVDRIIEFESGKRVVGIKNVSVNEPFFQGHFPDHPIMPGVLITEAMAQVGGVLLMSSVDNPESKLVYFSGIDGARFRKPVTPGDQIRFELEMVKMRGPICKMRGVACVDGEKVAEADLMSTIVDR